MQHEALVAGTFSYGEWCFQTLLLFQNMSGRITFVGVKPSPTNVSNPTNTGIQSFRNPILRYLLGAGDPAWPQGVFVCVCKLRRHSDLNRAGLTLAVISSSERGNSPKDAAVTEAEATEQLRLLYRLCNGFSLLKAKGLFG